MAHLFRPKKVYYVDGNGKRVPAGTPGAKKVKETLKKWYAKGSPLPKGKAIPLAADKRAALQMLAKIEQQIERGETALGGPEVEAAKRPLSAHLVDYEAHLKAEGCCSEHVKRAIARSRRVLTACAMERTADLSADKVQQFLADLCATQRALPSLDPEKTDYRKSELAALLGITPGAVTALVARHRLPATGQGKARRFPRETAEALRQRLVQPPGPQTANHHLTSIKSFVRWMVRHGRLVRNPLESLKYANAKKDLRRDRRSLSVAELLRLFKTTGESDTVYRGLTGTDRLMVYLVACGTGFRSGELAVLTPESFLLDATPPVVALPAREDKAGRSVTQPLPPSLVEPLRDYLSGKAKRQPVWSGAWSDRGAEMLRIDLDAAGIPYSVEGPDGPQYADFHSLRHSFVALLEHAGLSLKQAMALARHSDPKLTMARYGKAQLADLGAAVGRLPELAAPRGADPKPLDALPPDLLKALAVLGLAGLAAGWFGESENSPRSP